MDDRQLTFIVLPHGDLETRTFVISYRKLKFLGILSLIGVVLLCFILASWFPVAATAARVPALNRDLKQLEAERAEVQRLAKDLADVEAQYNRVRDLLGADAPVAGSPPLLPPRFASIITVFPSLLTLPYGVLSFPAMR